MYFVEPSVEVINEPDLFKRIELAGRTCYKSHDKITDDSAYPFYQRMVKSGHLSVIEHSNIIVRTRTPEATTNILACISDYTRHTGKPCYIRYSNLGERDHFVENYGYCWGDEYVFSGNIRAWRDLITMFWGEDLFVKLFSKHPAFKDIWENSNDLSSVFDDEYDPFFDATIIESVDGYDNVFETDIEDFHKIITVKVIADRGLIDEFRTHRQHSFSVESTRYCNYKDGDCTYCFPFWYDKIKEDPKYESIASVLGNACYDSEQHYNEIMNKVGVPQVARGALNLWVKSEAVITATVASWKNFLDLRSSAAAHPESQKICKMIKEATGL